MLFEERGRLSLGGRTARIAAAVLSLGPICRANADANQRPDQEFDQPGGVSSRHVVALARPGADPFGFERSSDGGGPLESRLSSILDRYKVSGIRRALSEKAVDAALASSLGLDRFYVLETPAGTNTVSLAADLAASADMFESVEVTGLGRWDTIEPDLLQWGLHNVGQPVCGILGQPNADIRATQAWELATPSPSITIAILDTGVSQSHPNLAPSLLPGRNFIPNAAPDATDDTSTNTPHGTVCAGIAAGLNIPTNSFVGVAPGCRILPVVVGNALYLDELWAANGVVWAADHGARVISMSFSTPTGASVFSQAVKYAYDRGCLLVSSSGNVASGSIQFPSRWPSVICVGATDSSDSLATFTTTGTAMDVSAPGVKIWSTWDSTAAPECGPGVLNGFGFASGTSMAAPHVSGLAALVMSANPGLSAPRVRQVIETTVDDRGAPGWDPQFGYGRINAERAVRTAMNLARCEADWDNNGSVDTTDIAGYVNDWLNDVSSGGLLTDLNRNGVVEVSDMASFVNGWVQSLSNGC